MKDVKLPCVFLPHSETLETERALMEERCEDKINNLQKNLKKYYSQELEVRAGWGLSNENRNHKTLVRFQSKSSS